MGRPEQAEDQSMAAIYEHPSYFGRVGSQPAVQAPRAPFTEAIPDARVAVLATANRSCCCVAKPAVIALIPVSTGRRQTDLLLCMHHYRASREQLTRSGARVLDASGAVMTDRDLW
jgi:hypothetical protein